MPDPALSRPESWAPYLTWAKHHPHARYDLCGSNLLHCSVDDLPGARESLELFARNDDGYPPLVEAIAERYGVAPDRVTTASGAAGATFLALGALVRPGDTILAEWPGYDPQTGAARFLGANVRMFDRAWSDGFQVDPDRVARELTSTTRVIMLTNLHNPSGVYADASTLLAIGEMAEAVGAKVLVDEVYLEAGLDLDTTPAATRGDVFVSVSSLTKSFGLAGLRLGWMLADPDTVEAVRRTRDVVDGTGAVPSERLGTLAFEHIDRLLERAHAILEPHWHMLERFVESRSELEWVAPVEGSCVAFPRLVGTADAGPFVDMARDEFGVGLVPGSFFGAPAHFRIAIGGKRQTLEDGIEALGKALDKGMV
ncbi:MAG: aminotransferase class I/II-fold pyridoxal phosphate-dependent enzyme [Gemmatimonadetes bacterium]|nr:aminotransferase class I/II-fold pyridoxal phosphate-dependent enzyme [Gemmatimonadota bacterium]